MALSDSLADFISQVDFFLSDPMFLTPNDPEFDCTPPTGRLRTAVLKLRDEADYLRCDLDCLTGVPPRDVCMPRIRLLREALYKETAERGSYYEGPSANPRIESYRRNLACMFGRVSLQETFEFVAAEIESYIADGYQDWAHCEAALKLRDECLMMNWVFANRPAQLPAGHRKLLRKIKEMRLAGKSVADTAAAA